MTRTNDPPDARATPPVAAEPDRACATEDPELFFPITNTQLRLAKNICKRCPHKQPCLDWAVETRQAFGVLGGTGPDERAEIIETLEAS